MRALAANDQDIVKVGEKLSAPMADRLDARPIVITSTGTVATRPTSAGCSDVRNSRDALIA
jgi:hypothetical protein